MARRLAGREPEIKGRGRRTSGRFGSGESKQRASWRGPDPTTARHRLIDQAASVALAVKGEEDWRQQWHGRGHRPHQHQRLLVEHHHRLFRLGLGQRDR